MVLSYCLLLRSGFSICASHHKLSTLAIVYKLLYAITAHGTEKYQEDFALVLSLPLDIKRPWLKKTIDPITHVIFYNALLTIETCRFSEGNIYIRT